MAIFQTTFNACLKKSLKTEQKVDTMKSSLNLFFHSFYLDKKKNNRTINKKGQFHDLKICTNNHSFKFFNRLQWLDKVSSCLTKFS